MFLTNLIPIRFRPICVIGSNDFFGRKVIQHDSPDYGMWQAVDHRLTPLTVHCGMWRAVDHSQTPLTVPCGRWLVWWPSSWPQPDPHDCSLWQVASVMAEQLTTVCCDAVESITREGEELDLHMVEVMEMKVRTIWHVGSFNWII